MFVVEKQANMVVQLEGNNRLLDFDELTANYIHINKPHQPCLCTAHSYAYIAYSFINFIFHKPGT